jgi:3-oxoacyl-[acyl-carrier-protein] synthase II
MSRRVVITGIGMVTPLGLTAADTWSELLAGTCGLGPIAGFDASGLPTRVAGEVKKFRARDYIENVKNLKVMTPAVQFGMAAVKLAFDEAKLGGAGIDPERFGIAVGAGQATGESHDLVPAIEASTSGDGSFDIVKFGREGLAAINPLWLLRGLSNNVLGFASARLDAQGWNTNICTSGAAGLMAIGDAAVAVATGRADVVVAGGYDANVSPEAILRHSRLGLLTSANDAGGAASRPFDLRRDGFVPADGAAFMVIEALDHAWARKADIIAEVLGYGVSNDAWRLLDPDPAGAGLARAMSAALADAEVPPGAVRAVFAHGTSNPRYDRSETLAIKTALGEHAKKVPVPAIKGALGHTIAASGAITAAAAALAARDGKIPPTLHLEERDPDCDLDHVTQGSRAIAAGPILINASGLGGQNASLVLASPERPGP